MVVCVGEWWKLLRVLIFSFIIGERIYYDALKWGLLWREDE